ncbi:M67 family metallopeptidase [Algiphilus sp.]|uniref:M67 family metallopeptidase n=1 Tax=Algiphilus sp. TaxID=1872431 RepID=UPI0025BE07B8|nr:M67 family metallopeptidase [Algiphilus sp.]MCI5104870.1 M67 family metallopeptidase [Algiphilus sp.]
MTSEEHVGTQREADSGEAPAIVLPRRIAIQLMHEAQRQPDREVCGLIAESGNGDKRIYVIRNAAAAPEKAFEMDPQALVAAHRRMREAGEQLWAIYHSHPHGDATPSSVDLRESGHPEALQIIVSLDIRGVLQLRAWRFTDDGPREQRLIVSDE